MISLLSDLGPSMPILESTSLSATGVLSIVSHLEQPLEVGPATVASVLDLKSKAVQALVGAVYATLTGRSEWRQRAGQLTLCSSASQRGKGRPEERRYCGSHHQPPAASSADNQ